MKKYFVLMIFNFVLFSTYMNANEGVYMKVSSGLNFLDNAKEWRVPGYFLGESFGYKFSNGLCIEVEHALRRNKFQGIYENTSLKGHLASETFLVHGIYYIPYSFKTISPYFGFGLGYCKQEVTGKAKTFGTYFPARGKFKGRSQGFSWDLIAGLAYPVTEKIEIDLEGKYLHTKLKSNDISCCVGIKYYFN